MMNFICFRDFSISFLLPVTTPPAATSSAISLRRCAKHFPTCQSPLRRRRYLLWPNRPEQSLTASEPPPESITTSFKVCFPPLNDDQRLKKTSTHKHTSKRTLRGVSHFDKKIRLNAYGFDGSNELLGSFRNFCSCFSAARRHERCLRQGTINGFNGLHAYHYPGRF